MFGRKQTKTLAETVQHEIDLAEHDVLHHYQEMEKHQALIEMHETRIKRLKSHPTQPRLEAKQALEGRCASQVTGLMNAGSEAAMTSKMVSQVFDAAPRSLKDRVDNPLGDN